MDEQVSLIAERLQLLRIKYENLIQVSMGLLEPWPAALSPDEASMSQTEAPLPPPPLPFSSEIESIDKILAVAQKVRGDSHVDATTPTNSKDSLKKAKSVYKSHLGTKPTTASASSSTAAAAGRKPSLAKKRKDKVGVPLPPPPPTTTAATVKLIHSKKCTSQSLDATEKDQLFTLKSKGGSLELPSKYRRLRNVISKLGETNFIKVHEKDGHVDEDDTFLQNMKVSDKEERETYAKLCLNKAELSLLQETLASFPTHKSTVIELEDVMESKVRLEVLLQSANDALAADKKDTPQQQYCPTAQKSSFLNVEHMKLVLENEFLSLCTSHLLPLLQSMDPSDHRYTRLIHLIQNIAGLQKTIFVSAV